eukprot:227194-Ditylum_brightwellii.AAC.1
MKTQLAQNKVPHTEVCTTWLQENVPDHEPEGSVPVPDFCLITSKASWGNGPERVKTTVIKLLCTEKDRLYLKSLLSHVWNDAQLRGTFVPAQACLVTSLETYKNLLRNHN